MIIVPFVGEFVGTAVFALIVLLVLISVPSKLLFWTSLSIGLGLALGIWISLLIGGPGYLNPAIAVLVGVKDDKSTAFTSAMVLAEFLAVLLVLSVYFWMSSSSSSSSPPSSASSSSSSPSSSSE